MDPEALFGELRGLIIGRVVNFHRLAANSLILYVDGEPGSKSGLTIWLEPTWHLRGPDRVLTGSREAQEELDDQEADSGFKRAAAAVKALSGRVIKDVRVEDITGDLCLDLDGGYLLRTFVSDPSDDELWHVRNCATGIALFRSGRAFGVRQTKI